MFIIIYQFCIEMVRIQAANEHFLKKTKQKRRSNSIEEIYKPNEKSSQTNGGISSRSKMMISKSQPDLKFKNKKGSSQNNEDNEHISEYSDEVR